MAGFNSQYTLQPHEVMELYFEGQGTEQNTYGVLIVIDHDGLIGSWTWRGSWGAPEFIHDGNTGSVVFNDPASGDVKVWRDSFAG